MAHLGPTDSGLILCAIPTRKRGIAVNSEVTRGTQEVRFAREDFVAYSVTASIKGEMHVYTARAKASRSLAVHRTKGQELLPRTGSRKTVQEFDAFSPTNVRRLL